MDSTSARFSVERQDGGAWRALTRCNRLDYAQAIAAAGLQRHLGSSYRAIDNQTGEQIALGSANVACAA